MTTPPGTATDGIVTEPGAAIRAITVEAGAHQHRQRARIVLAVLMLMGTVCVFIGDEGRRWQPSIDVGLKVSRYLRHVEQLTPGGIASRAGVRIGDRPIAFDGERFGLADHGRLSGLPLDDETPASWSPLPSAAFFTSDGWLRLREDTMQLTFRARSTDKRLCDGPPEAWPIVDGVDPCSSERVDFVLVADGPLSRARNAHVPYALLQGLLCIVVLSLSLTGMFFVVSSQRPITIVDADDLRRRSFVVPAVVMAVLVPLFIHAVVLTALGPAEAAKLYLPIVGFTMTMPHIVGLVLVANAAARHADGDFDTKTTWWPLVITAMVPGVVLGGVPTAGVLLTCIAVMAVQKRWHLLRLRREAPDIADVSAPR